MSLGTRPKTSTSKHPLITPFPPRAIVYTGPEQHARFSQAEQKTNTRSREILYPTKQNFYKIRICREEANLDKINKEKEEFKNLNFQKF